MFNEIEEAIKKNLPAKVGEELQKELAELKALREQNKTQEIIITTDKQRLAELLEERELYKDLLGRERAIGATEQALLIRKAVLAVREEHATERVAEIRALAADVFKNRQISRISYTDVSGHGLGQDQYGNAIPFNAHESRTSTEDDK